MRLEWLPIVRNRAWHEFEIIAKEDPSWLFYETVRELEMGLPDRDDRFRLGQILKVLTQQGYGEEDAATPTRSPYRPIHPFRMAAISDSQGCGELIMIFTFNIEKDRITFMIVNRVGTNTYKAIVQKAPFKPRPLNRARAETRPPSGHEHVREFPFEYACQRAVDLFENKVSCSEPSALLQRGQRLIAKQAAGAPHPADLFETPDLSREELSTLWRFIPETKDWLVFLDEDLSCSLEVAKTTVDLRSSVNARADRRYELYRGVLDEFANPMLMKETAERFKDLAYMLAGKNRWEEAMQLAAMGRSIDNEGVESTVFDSMLRHTAKVVPAHLSERLMKQVGSKLAA